MPAADNNGRSCSVSNAFNDDCWRLKNTQQPKAVRFVLDSRPIVIGLFTRSRGKKKCFYLRVLERRSCRRLLARRPTMGGYFSRE